MVEQANIARKFTANACLHHHTAPARSFLRRNIRHILDSHEKVIHRKPDDASRSEDMIANERQAAGWDFPTKEMLDDLTKGDKPVLQLTGLQIRHPKSKSRKRKRDARDEGDECSDWLPDPQVNATWPCQVSVAVREKESSKRAIYVESRHATVSQRQEANAEHGHFEITLAEPFLIEVSKLFVAIETGTNGFRHWRRTVTTCYNLEISVQCRDSDESADFLSELEGQPRARYEQIPGLEGILRASWDELPKCPASDQGLILKRTRGHSLISLDYRMELSMGWSRKRDSPLQRHNKAFLQTSDQNRQLMTPSSEDAEKATKYVITYKFSEGLNTRVKKVEGLRCPLCKEQPTSFPRLLLHCSTFHDHFRFEVDLTEPDSGPDRAVISKTVLLSISPQQYEKATREDSDERCNWVAPRRPFDLRAHLAGDHSWTGHAKAKKSGRRGRQTAGPVKDTQPVSAPRPVISRPTPEQVPHLPFTGHKKHRVPDVPGVRFYHGLSKKAIEPGEMVADSDGSVDEFWMADIERQALKELDIHGAAQEFSIAFNRHLAREQSTSSVLVKEAIVRFTRLHRRELRDVEWQRAFRRKLEQLLGVGVIDRGTVTYCIQLLRTTDADGDVLMTNGVSEAGAAPTDTAEAVANGAAHKAPNGLRKPEQVNGTASRTPSLGPNGRGTPTTNGVRKGKERVRWGAGGSLSRDSPAAASPLINDTTPGGASPSINGTSMELPKTNGAMNIETQPSSTHSQVIGTHTPSPRAKTNGNNTPHHQQQQGARGLCLCAKSAKDTRAAVICRNPKCLRKDFHLACVGLERREVGWKCKDCAAL